MLPKVNTAFVLKRGMHSILLLLAVMSSDSKNWLRQILLLVLLKFIFLLNELNLP